MRRGSFCFRNRTDEMPVGRPKGTPKTGGWQKGGRNKRTLAFRAEVAKSKQTPLEYMVAVMHDEKADKDRRDRMAAAAATGVDQMDQHGFDGRATLAEIVLRHPQIERILCGHLHRAIESRFAGAIVGTAPSTAHQLVLDLRPGASLSFRSEERRV